MNRREMLAVTGSAVACSLFPASLQAKNTVTFCPELIQELKLREPIHQKWLRANLISKSVTDPIDSMNLAMLLENQSQYKPENFFTKSILDDHFLKMISHTFSLMSNFFNVWTLPDTKDKRGGHIYWQKKDQVVQQENIVYPKSYKTRVVTTVQPLEKEAVDVYYSIICDELNSEFVRGGLCDLRNNAPKLKKSIARFTPNEIKTVVKRGLQHIKEKTGVEPTYMVTSPEIINILGLDFKNNDNFTIGLRNFEYWEGLNVWCDALLPTKEILLGHKAGPFSGGYAKIFGSPFLVAPAVIDPNFLTLNQTIFSRYVRQLENKDLYCSIRLF